MIEKAFGRLPMLARRGAPTVSLRLEAPAGLWSSAPGPRLAAVCAAACACLRDFPVLGGHHPRSQVLKIPAAPRLRVSPEGGQRSVEIEEADRLEPATLEGALAQGQGRGQGGLEVLDLSALEVTDWRGTVQSPAVARLVLLGPVLLPSPEAPGHVQAFPLVLDFDSRLVEAGTAARFLSALVARLKGGPRA